MKLLWNKKDVAEWDYMLQFIKKTQIMHKTSSVTVYLQ